MSRDTSKPIAHRVQRRPFLKTIGAGVSTLGVAGCQSLGQSEEEPAAERTGGAEDVAQDEFKGETLKMGGMWPIPSDYTIGRDAQRGAQLAIREHNRSDNGVLGGELQLINRNTGISPARGRKNTRELIEDEGVDAINGGFLGQTYKQMLEPIANNKTMSFFSCGASVPVARKIASNFERYKYSFRSICNMIQARKSELNFIDVMADEMGWDRIAVYTENLEVFDAVADPLVKGLEERGIAEVPISQRTSQSIINWKPLFDQAEEANCDLVCANLVLTGMTAARQWGTQERPFDFGGIHLLSMAPDFWEAVGKVAPGLWTMNMGGFDSRQTEKMIPMQNRFKEEFGYKTSSYSCFCAYDAVNTWVDAIKQTGSKEPEDLIPYLESRTWDGSVIDNNNEYQGPDSDTPHDWKWNGGSVENWNQIGWLPFTQWQGEKGGNASMVTVGPKRSAGGEYKLQKTPWLQ